jgi:multiple sugar transport system ATP-binding protein
MGTPDEIYARPDDLFVAGCLGSPAINTFTARLTHSSGSYRVTYGQQQLELDSAEADRHMLTPGLDQDVVVGIRPEAVLPVGTPSETGEGRRLIGEVVTRESLGSDLFVLVDLRSPAEVARARDGRQLVGEGSLDSFRVLTDHRILARFPAGSPVSEGEQVALSVTANSLHLFDPATGITWAKARAQALSSNPVAPTPAVPGGLHAS